MRWSMVAAYRLLGSWMRAAFSRLAGHADGVVAQSAAAAGAAVGTSRPMATSADDSTSASARISPTRP